MSEHEGTRIHQQQEFVHHANQVRQTVEPFLLKFFGCRCPEFVYGCVVCSHWRALDDLLANPFDKEE